MGRLFGIVDNFGEVNVRFVSINRVFCLEFSFIWTICNVIHLNLGISVFEYLFWYWKTKYADDFLDYVISSICYVTMWIINSSFWDTSRKRLNFY